MKEMHISEFLKEFSAEDLIKKGILRGRTKLLQNTSVDSLIKLMTKMGVSRLVAPEREWFLGVDGSFQNPLATETQSGKSVFDYQNTSINPHYLGYAGSDSAPIQDEPSGLKFGLERDLQKALRTNIQQLERGLRIVDGGVEKTVEAGRIDITAEDADGYMVIVELKAGTADLGSIAQLLSYIGSVSDDSSRLVRGILVANDFHPRLIIAAKAVPNIKLIAYSIHFSFEER